MGKIKFAILEEGDYVSGFAAYVCQHREDWIELHCFTDIKNLKQYMSDSRIDILLIGEKFLLDFQDFEKVNKTIMLSEVSCVPEDTKYAVVFKYQSVEKLLKDVCGEIASGEGFSLASTNIGIRDKELIGVYSPWGGCESSLYAQMLCRKKKTDKTVLYVNLHLLDIMSFQDKEKKSTVKKSFGMSEIIYFIRQRRENAALKLRSIIREYKGVESVYPVEDYRDLYGMTPDDAKIFFRLLSNESMYDVIVFDIGFLSEASLLLLKWCDSIYMSEASCEIEKACMKSFYNLLYKEGMEEIGDKSVTFKMDFGGENI